jgi:hypothetical protein
MESSFVISAVSGVRKNDSGWIGEDLGNGRKVDAVPAPFVLRSQLC